MEDMKPQTYSNSRSLVYGILGAISLTLIITGLADFVQEAHTPAIPEVIAQIEAPEEEGAFTLPARLAAVQNSIEISRIAE